MFADMNYSNYRVIGEYPFLGLANEDGEQVLAPKWKMIMFYEKAVVVKDKLRGVFSYEGKEILGPIFNKLSLKEDIIIAQMQGKTAIYNYEGRLLIDNIYQYILHHQAIEVKHNKDGGWALYDYSGKQILEPVWEFLILHPEFIQVKAKNGGLGIFGYDGKVIIEPIWKQIRFESYGVSVLKDNKLYKFDYEGNQLSIT